MTTPTDAAGKPLTKSQHLLDWVDEIARLTKPDRVVWCDGSDEEKHRLTEETVAKGILTPLNQQKLPGCYIHRSNPNDVARVEQLTFICTPTKDEAGPTSRVVESSPLGGAPGTTCVPAVAVTGCEAAKDD